MLSTVSNFRRKFSPSILTCFFSCARQAPFTSHRLLLVDLVIRNPTVATINNTIERKIKEYTPGMRQHNISAKIIAGMTNGSRSNAIAGLEYPNSDFQLLFARKISCRYSFGS